LFRFLNWVYITKTDQDYVTAYVSFTLDAHNVTSIKDYNNGGYNPGNYAYNCYGYLSLDIKNKPDNEKNFMSIT